MKILNLMEGIFRDRPNRFTVEFETSSGIEKAHLRDPGRLKELLIPGVELLLRPALNPESRKTKYDVIAVWSEGIWVLINSGFHSDLAAEMIKSKIVLELSDYTVKKREYTFGKSRLDFLLTKMDKLIKMDKRGKKESKRVSKKNSLEVDHDLLMEVKGCTLVEEGHARFPDAPTIRGKRHLEELIKAKKEGMESAVLFLIPREDAKVFSPNWEMDPDFSKTLKQAEHENVKIIAYSFTLDYHKKELELKPLKKIKVKVKP
ncbi:DNA/RNA nuclease SfsA [Methanobacterium formicicum]|uniref:Sugar fermentation stimulation protein homolog n=1 Tax=Methanobacterium formicicum (strain DSM 3637 / PP1) TaxID=1204725 RepID=K2RW75_METFP|nr:DNA/RNA nuclease SfsA [Methanobacterium formicicum]EKF87015.1 sugar fermentation stimulation protein A [Methanobacterium formicicum DSM 3637]